MLFSPSGHFAAKKWPILVPSWPDKVPGQSKNGPKSCFSMHWDLIWPMRQFPGGIFTLGPQFQYGPIWPLQLLWGKKWNAISSGPSLIPKSVLTSYGATERESMMSSMHFGHFCLTLLVMLWGLNWAGRLPCLSCIEWVLSWKIYVEMSKAI